MTGIQPIVMKSGLLPGLAAILLAGVAATAWAGTTASAPAPAAQRQGKFWEYHESLLRSPRLDRDALFGLATTVGLDREAFARNFDAPALRRQVTAEAQKAREVGALGSPGFLINGHAETGWASLPCLEQVIRAHRR